MAKYLEDFREGEVWQSGPIVIGEDELIAYAKANDPQPIHVDPDAAKNGPFGGIIASGWQIAALSMRLFVEAGGHGDAPIVGIGIDELRWRQAVRPGDALRTTRVHDRIDGEFEVADPGLDPEVAALAAESRLEIIGLLANLTATTGPTRMRALASA